MAQAMQALVKAGSLTSEGERGSRVQLCNMQPGKLPASWLYIAFARSERIAPAVIRVRFLYTCCCRAAVSLQPEGKSSGGCSEDVN